MEPARSSLRRPHGVALAVAPGLEAVAAGRLSFVAFYVALFAGDATGAYFPRPCAGGFWPVVSRWYVHDCFFSAVSIRSGRYFLIAEDTSGDREMGTRTDVEKVAITGPLVGASVRV